MRTWLRWLPGMVVVALLVGFFVWTAPERAAGERRQVIVLAAASLTNVDELFAANIERIAVAEPTSVPAGIYAREAPQSLGLKPGAELYLVGKATSFQVIPRR